MFPAGDVGLLRLKKLRCIHLRYNFEVLGLIASDYVKRT